MSLSLAATLSIACGKTSAHGEQKSIEALPQKPVSRKPLDPHLPDRTEGLLSPDILAMQHRVRKGKHRGLEARAKHRHGEKPDDDAKKTHKRPKQKAQAEVVDKDDIKDDWELVDLADVQQSHLEAMDLTDLSSSLLEHPKDPDVEYTAEEERALRGRRFVR